MSITPTLKAAARAAYRDVWRASTVTFRGDETVLQAFRQKIRMDATNASREATTPESYEQSTKLFRDIAVVLRHNIVQASKVRQMEDGKDLYRVHMRSETELGDNYSIKNPAPVDTSSRSARKREKLDAAPPKQASDFPVFYSALKRAHKERIVPELREEDLEESFVRGSGPGGQSINKTENNVQLLHKPTGLRVACQDTRSLSQNRSRARKWLLEKLDRLMNPGMSKEDMKAAKQRERERRRRKKAKKRDQARAAAKDEDVED
ncbi:RF-1 domain-containing protein [Ephemerocybe angulata]|uniref:RF-1 domain-containing protein n=1 Tax=Ephemerocybe angulata TaxID=980116 RepID=A0A8H6MFX5_9AGAR|nr:RF-1 domain-containing protein [Tulosesus angulatus]